MPTPGRPQTLLHRVRQPLAALACVLAAATCTSDQGGPSTSGRGYFSFRPTYQLAGGATLSQFGIVADSVRVRLTRPVDVLVIDTTVPFPPDSTALHLALPLMLQQSPETLDAVIEIRSAGTVIFVDTLQTEVVDGPPGSSPPPTVLLTYVGPGTDVEYLYITPPDTTIVLGDTLFFSATATDIEDTPVPNFYVGWKTSDTTIARINAQGRFIAPSTRGSVQVIGFTPTGAADTTTVTFAPVPVIITRDSGNAQTGLASDSLAAEFVARVKGSDSLGISGISVRFQAVTAGGAVRDTLLVTDAAGRVRTRGVLGTTSGSYSYSATVVGTAITTTFTATAGSAGASTIAIQGGNGQVDSAGRTLAAALTVRVADAFNNPVNNAKVYWTRPVGTGTVIPDSSFTDASGIATASYILGNVGTDSIQAALAGTSAFVTFGATAINGAPATLNVLFGDGQTATVGQPLTDSLIVQVLSAAGRAVVGTNVTWTVLRGGSTSAGTTPTNTLGWTAVRYTAGTTPGTDSVQVQVGALSTVITATAVTGAPSAMALVSGNAQTDTAGRTLAQPLVVHVTDAFGNDVTGAQVAWTVLRGGNTSADTVATGGSGQASVGYTLGLVPGVDSVQAHLVGTGATVLFTESVEVLTASQLLLVSGDAQTDTVARVLLPMVVEARASDGRVVDSTPIQWVIASGSGTLGAPSTLTDSTGRTSNTLTLPVAPGGTTVLAILSGQDTVTFTATATPDAPTSFTIQSGGGPQSDTVDATLPQFVVQVTDSFGNPRSGLVVVWTRIAGSGTPGLDTNVTDGGGLAFFTYVLGPTVGADTVRAALLPTGAALDFTATTLHGLADSLIVLGGDAQTDTVGQLLPVNLSVQLVDRHLNPVNTTPVAFVTTAGTGTAAPDTVVTDASGNVTTGFTLGTVAGAQSVEARARGGAVVATFSFTALPDAPTVIAKIGGDGQADTANAILPIPLQVSVTDAFGNPIAGTTVVFDPFAGGGSLFPDTVLTDGAGLASSSWTLGAVLGADSVFVSVLSTGASVTFTATTLAAAPAALNYVSGDAQTDTVARTLAAPFVVRMQDAGNNGVPGLMVVFAVASGGGGPSLSADSVVTDSLGYAATSLTLGTTAGSFTVRATATAVSDTVIFSAFAVNDLPAAIALVGGSGQAVGVLLPAPSPFDVHVTDAYGNSVDGATVLWSVVAGSGSVAPDTTFTAGGGLASANFTAGASIGTDTVLATLAGTSASVAAGIDVLAGPPITVTLVSGDSQSAAIGTPFAAPLVVLVSDSLGNPVVGAAVTWTHDSGGIGSFTPDTSIADAAGHATTVYTPQSVAGSRTLRATFVAAPATVTFSGTALAGAPTTIAVDLGDGQTDTVLSTLATPLQVLVTDGSSNLVDAAPIAWEIASGSATLNDSSTVTDPAGHSSVTLTFGLVSGPVTLRAILGAGVDTAFFTVTSLPGVATTLVAVSGDAQTGIVSTPVALPLIARVVDGYGNGVPGEIVGMSVTLGGGSLDSVESTTDSLGFARAVTWTLGATVGTNQVTMAASTPVLLAQILTFTATSLPIGTSKSWAGTVSTDWNDPNNWTPTGVPLATEGVFIPAGTPFSPVLTSSSAVAALTIQTGAGLDNGGWPLDVGGDLRPGSGIIGAGTVTLSGAGVTVEGNISNLTVNGSATLSAPISIGGALGIGGHLDLNGATGTVGTSLTTSGFGYLTMNQPAESLTVTGTANFAGGDEGGSLTAGVLRLGGNFQVTSPFPDAFAAGPAFVTEFIGPVLQNVQITQPQFSSFGQFRASGAGGVQFLTDVTIQGTATLTGGGVSAPDRHITVGGDLVDANSDRWNVDTTDFTGTPFLPDTIHGTVFLRNDVSALSHDFTVAGELIVRGPSAIFTPNGHTVTVGTDLVVDSSAVLYMINAPDSLLVTGNALFGGASTSGQLTQGVLRIGRVFAQSGDPQAFAPSGTHQTVFGPAVAYDSISFANPGATASHFHHVEFEGPTGFYRYFTGNAVVTGQMVVDAGASVYNFNSNPNGKLTVTSKLPIGSGFWSVDMLEVAGNVVMDSATNVYARLTRITGATSTLDVNGQNLYIDGDLDVRNSGLLRMATPGSLVTVNKNATFGGRSTLGQLTEGDLYLNGDFTQSALTNVRSFQASGSHNTWFQGSSEQLAVFGSPGPSSSRFQELNINNTGGVVFGSLAVVNGNANDYAGAVSGVVGVTIASDLYDPNGLWRPATTTFTGFPTLPDSLYGSIVFTGTLSPSHPIKVIGSVTLSGPFATLSLDDNPHLTITDSLVTELGGTLDMTGTTDTVDVGGSAYFTGNSSLFAGTLIVRGNFEQAGNATAFDPQPGFLTVLAPSGTDTVTFANPDSTSGSGSGFADLTLQADGQRLVLASHVEVRGLFSVPASAATDPVIEGNGNALTVRDVNIDGLTLERTPLQIAQTSTAQQLTVDNVSFTSFLSTDTQLYVSNPGTGGFQGSFNNVFFTPLTGGDTGFYVVVNNSDVVGPNFLIGIVGSNVGNGPSFSGSINSGSASWF